MSAIETLKVGVRKAPIKLATVALLASCLAIPQASAGSKSVAKGIAAGIGAAIILKAIKDNQKTNRRSVRKSKSRKKTTRRAVRKKSGASNRARTAKAKPRKAIPPLATTALSKDQVFDIQKRLNALGHDAGAPDGLPGRNTHAAVKSFQRSIGRPETGTLNQPDMVALYQRSEQKMPTTMQANAITRGVQQPTFPTFGSPAPGQKNASVNGVIFPTFGGAAVAGQSLAGGSLPAQGQPSFPNYAQNGLPQQPAYHGGANGQQQAMIAGQPQQQIYQPTFGNVAPVQQQPSIAGHATGGFQIQGGQGFAQPAPLPGQPLKQTGVVAQPKPMQQAALPAQGVQPGAAGPSLASTGGDQVVPTPMVSEIPAPMAGDFVGDDADDPLANAPLAEQFVEEKPAIHGIRTGDPISQAVAKLSSLGHNECVAQLGSYTCTKASGNMVDQVALRHTTPAAGGGVVYLLARTLTFKKPVRRSFLTEQMMDDYPALLDSPDWTLASKACRLALQPKTGTILKSIDTSLPEGCESYQSVRLGGNPEDNATSKLTIVFYDGNEYIDPAKQALLDAESELEGEIKF